MVDDAVAVVAVLLWLMTAIEAANVARRRHPEPALNMLLATFGLLAVSATFFVPTVHLAAGHVTGMANIGEPIARTALLGAAWTVQVMLQRLGDPGFGGIRAGRRAAVLAVFVAALWGCFLASPVDRATTMFTRDYGDVPVVAAYLLVSLAYLAVALVDVIRGTMLYGRRAHRALAVALRIIGIGCWLGLGYVAVKVVYVLALVTGRGAADGALESTAARLLAVGGGLLVIAGSVVPFLATRTARAQAWASAYRDLRRLYPLWQLMYRATPGIALEPPRSALADALRLRDLDLRLYRRFVEIQDGRLALLPYLNPVTDGNAAAEAAALLEAVACKRRDEPVEAPAAPPPERPATLPEEVAWLVQVADQLQRLDVTDRRDTAENPGTTSTPRTAP